MMHHLCFAMVFNVMALSSAVQAVIIKLIPTTHFGDTNQNTDYFLLQVLVGAKYRHVCYDAWWNLQPQQQHFSTALCMEKDFKGGYIKQGPVHEAGTLATFHIECPEEIRVLADCVQVQEPDCADNTTLAVQCIDRKSLIELKPVETSLIIGASVVLGITVAALCGICAMNDRCVCMRCHRRIQPHIARMERRRKTRASSSASGRIRRQSRQGSYSQPAPPLTPLTTSLPKPKPKVAHTLQEFYDQQRSIVFSDAILEDPTAPAATFAASSRVLGSPRTASPEPLHSSQPSLSQAPYSSHLSQSAPAHTSPPSPSQLKHSPEASCSQDVIYSAFTHESVHLNTTDIVDMHALYSPEDIASFVTHDASDYKTTNIVDMHAHSSHYCTSDVHVSSPCETTDAAGMPESPSQHYPATQGSQNFEPTTIVTPLSSPHPSETRDASDMPSLSPQIIRSLDIICSSIPEEPTNTKPTDVIDIPPPPPPQHSSIEAQIDEIMEESPSAKTTHTTDTTTRHHSAAAPNSSTTMITNPSQQFDMTSINLSQPTIILITPPPHDLDNESDKE